MSKEKSSIVLNEGSARFGDTITFTVQAEPAHKVDLTQLYVKCTKNGAVVYNSGGYPIPASFTLTSQAWEALGGGAADAVASLSSFDPSDPSKTHPLATLTFPVGA